MSAHAAHFAHRYTVKGIRSAELFAENALVANVTTDGAVR